MLAEAKEDAPPPTDEGVGRAIPRGLGTPAIEEEEEEEGAVYGVVFEFDKVED